MSLDRQYQQKSIVTFVCDGCDRTQTVKIHRSWADVTKQLHRVHWRVRKEGNEWRHYCCSGCAMLGGVIEGQKSATV